MLLVVGVLDFVSIECRDIVEVWSGLDLLWRHRFWFVVVRI